MSTCVHWYADELVKSAQKTSKKNKMSQNKNNINLIFYYYFTVIL